MNYQERLTRARSTQKGDKWVHRKTGDVVEVVENSGYIRLRYPSGRRGYIIPSTLASKYVPYGWKVSFEVDRTSPISSQIDDIELVLDHADCLGPTIRRKKKDWFVVEDHDDVLTVWGQVPGSSRWTEADARRAVKHEPKLNVRAFRWSDGISRKEA